MPPAGERHPAHNSNLSHASNGSVASRIGRWSGFSRHRRPVALPSISSPVTPGSPDASYARTAKKRWRGARSFTAAAATDAAKQDGINGGINNMSPGSRTKALAQLTVDARAERERIEQRTRLLYDGLRGRHDMPAKLRALQSVAVSEAGSSAAVQDVHGGAGRGQWEEAAVADGATPLVACQPTSPRLGTENGRVWVAEKRAGVVEGRKDGVEESRKLHSPNTKNRLFHERLVSFGHSTAESDSLASRGLRDAFLSPPLTEAQTSEQSAALPSPSMTSRGIEQEHGFKWDRQEDMNETHEDREPGDRSGINKNVGVTAEAGEDVRENASAGDGPVRRHASVKASEHELDVNLIARLIDTELYGTQEPPRSARHKTAMSKRSRRRRARNGLPAEPENITTGEGRSGFGATARWRIGAMGARASCREDVPVEGRSSQFGSVDVQEQRRSVVERAVTSTRRWSRRMSKSFSGAVSKCWAPSLQLE